MIPLPVLTTLASSTDATPTTSDPTRPVDHAARAKTFTADEDRTDWHDGALWHVREKRDRSVAEVPEWETLRELASGIKEHTLSNLAGYLEQFEAAATANGVAVHWARDADEHNRIVAGILADAGATRLVKSKSMLTEECALNPYLEALGVEVVDTDLGERIVQFLDQDAASGDGVRVDAHGGGPSHIVMPAIHLKKEEVGTLFEHRLGTEAGNADPAYLTASARAHLRTHFLAADAALTGVNFAVAETGEIVVCTNEGNADLGVHLAPVQIHSMGLEKVIPRREDLGVFTRLLGRSATGQAITVYTTHHQRPRPLADGSRAAMHVVIVDNGRTEQLGREAFRGSLKCIRCAACMNTCPVYRRSGGHSYGSAVPGPIGSILTPGLDLRRYAALPFASTLCGSCTAVCPVKIDIHQQLFAWRQEVTAAGLAPRAKGLAMRAAGAALGRASLFARLGRAARWALRRLPRSVTHARANVWAQARDLPDPPAQVVAPPPPGPRLGPRAPPRRRAPVASPKAPMSARDVILAAARRNAPAPILRPEVPDALLTSMGTERAPLPDELVARFAAHSTAGGATVVEASEAGVAAAIRGAHPDATRIASAAPEWLNGTVELANASHDLADIELFVCEGVLGVAENAAVWLSESRLPSRVAPFLAPHVTIVLRRAAIVATMHDAYRQLGAPEGFGVFVAGPSKTADIEQSLVVGAHGPLSLTVVLVR